MDLVWDRLILKIRVHPLGCRRLSVDLVWDRLIVKFVYTL